MANKADNQIKWVLNKMPKSDDKQVANMSLEEMSKANNFHKSFPQYSVTLLQDFRIWPNISDLRNFM